MTISGAGRAVKLLTAAVGAGAPNKHDDVAVVQSLLKSNGCDPGKIDGQCGAKTIAAIRKFQAGFMSTPDGRVDPHGLTWQKLTGTISPLPPPAPPVHPSTTTEWSGDSSRWTQEKKLASLEPRLRSLVPPILEKLRAQGFQPKIFFGWRSVEVQQQIVARGDSTVLFSFHNAQKPDGTPNAYAADIVDSRWGWEAPAKTNGFWTALGAAAKQYGLVWGGDWVSFKDVAHIQSRQNSELAATKRESGL